MLSPAYLSLAFVLTAAPAPQGNSFRWKFKEGDVFYMKLDTSLKQTITATGNTTEHNHKHSTITRFTVKKKNRDGSVVLEQTFTGVHFKGDVPGIGDIQKKLKGITFKVTLDANGKLTGFEGYKDFLDKISGGKPAGRAAALSLFPEDVFKQDLRDTFSFGPDRKVSVGQTWKKPFRLPQGPRGDFAGENTFKYTGKANVGGTEVDRLTSTATLKYTPGKQVKGAPYQYSNSNLKAEDFKGTLLFDPAAGRLIETTTDAHITGSLTFSFMGRMADMVVDEHIRMKAQFSTKALSLE